MKQRIYLRKAKCVQCLRVNSNGKEAYKCNDDPSCAEGSIEIVLGHNPEIIRSRVYNKLSKAFDSDDIKNFEEFLTLLTSGELTEAGMEAAFEGFKNTVGDLIESSTEEQKIDEDELKMFESQNTDEGSNEVENQPETN